MGSESSRIRAEKRVESASVSQHNPQSSGIVGRPKAENGPLLDPYGIDQVDSSTRSTKRGGSQRIGSPESVGQTAEPSAVKKTGKKPELTEEEQKKQAAQRMAMMEKVGKILLFVGVAAMALGMCLGIFGGLALVPWAGVIAILGLWLTVGGGAAWLFARGNRPKVE